MKISELSRRARVPLPTIKFYIRERLLPPGASTGRNQADYSDEHLERLSLIRALRDDAGLTIVAIGRALAAADGSDDFVLAAIDAIERPHAAVVDESSPEYTRALRAVLDLTGAQGWTIPANSASLRDAARALVLIRRSFPEKPGESLAPYANAVASIAQHEIPDGWRPEQAPSAALRYAVLGTVLFEPFILALRRMAHIARSRDVRSEADRTPTKKAAPRTRRMRKQPRC